jgi:hypothetical protein
MNGHSQTGIVCCCHIDDYENNLILKHEKTRKSKEDDRTHHVLALNANAGPVFLTYRGVEEINAKVTEATAGAPLYDFTAADGVRHTVWKIENAQPFVDRLFQPCLCSTSPMVIIARPVRGEREMNCDVDCQTAAQEMTNATGSCRCCFLQTSCEFWPTTAS